MSNEKYNSILINIAELWLKGKNRKSYLTLLSSHIRKTMDLFHTSDFTIRNEGHKFFINCPTPLNKQTIEALSKISGISSIQPCRIIACNYDELKTTVLQDFEEILNNLKTNSKQNSFSFSVKTKRSNKNFPSKENPLNSSTISRQLGAVILIDNDKNNPDDSNPTLTVDLKKSEITIEIYVQTDKIFVSTKRIKGLGGLPVSSSGKMLTLISGGFDSPIASYLMFSRGVSQEYVFFHASPFIGNEVKEKIISIVEKLATYQPSTKLHIIPFGQLQKKITDNCPEDYRTLLFRKYMILASEYLARRRKISALINGDSLAQVSSQTIANLNIIDQTTELSIFRPLIAMNKEEILILSRKSELHDISVIPHDDACALLAPKHPILHGSKKITDHFSATNNFTKDIINCVRTAETFIFNQKGFIEKKIPKNFSDTDANNYTSNEKGNPQTKKDHHDNDGLFEF